MLIEKILIDENELYFKEFIDVLINNGYLVGLKKVSCINVDEEGNEKERFLYEVYIDE